MNRAAKKLNHHFKVYVGTRINNYTIKVILLIDYINTLLYK